MHIFHFSALLPFAFVSSNASMVSSFHPLFHLQPTSNSSNIQQLRSNQFCMLQKGAWKKHVLHFLCVLRIRFYYCPVSIFYVTSWSRTSSKATVSRVFLSLTFLCEFISSTEESFFYEGANSIPSSIFIVTLEFDSIFKVPNFFKWQVNEPWFERPLI